MAPEGFSGRFGSGSGEVMEGVRTLAAEFLLCFGMLSGTCCSKFHSCAGICFLKHRGNERKAEASMLSQNVQWLEFLYDLEFDPSLTSN